MSTYGLERVIHMWSVDKLTAEQAIGQILLLMQEMEERVKELERRADAQRVRGTGEGGGERCG